MKIKNRRWHKKRYLRNIETNKKSTDINEILLALVNTGNSVFSSFRSLFERLKV